MEFFGSRENGNSELASLQTTSSPIRLFALPQVAASIIVPIAAATLAPITVSSAPLPPLDYPSSDLTRNLLYINYEQYDETRKKIESTYPQESTYTQEIKKPVKAA